jgi:hypothetical protein
MNKPLPEWAREVLLKVGFTREELASKPVPRPADSKVVYLPAMITRDRKTSLAR